MERSRSRREEKEGTNRGSSLSGQNFWFVMFVRSRMAAARRVGIKVVAFFVWKLVPFCQLPELPEYIYLCLYTCIYTYAYYLHICIYLYMYVYLHICTSLATKYFRWIEQHNDHRSKKELWLNVQQFVSKCSKNLNTCINILKVQPHTFEFKCSIMNPCINIFYILIGGMKQLYFFICQLLRLHYFEEEEKSYLSKHGQWWHSKRGYIDIERALPGSFWKKGLTLEVIWRIG